MTDDKPAVRLCLSCGEPLSEHEQDAGFRCVDCRRELDLGEIPPPSTLQKGTGGGQRVIRSGMEMS